MGNETTTPAQEDPRDNSELIERYPDIASQLDDATLDLYGELFDTWRAAMAKVRSEGMVDILPGGIQRMSPYLKVANDAHDRMLRILAMYGMTPRSRAMGKGASLLRQQKPNAFAAFAAKHGGRENQQ